MALVEYCDAMHYPRFRIPNETFTRSWKQKTKNKKLGVSPGVPDLGVIVNHQLIFIELKRKKGGVVSDFQKEWIAHLEQANVPVRFCYGFEEAKAFIDEVAAK